MVIIHPHVDLDACACVALASEEEVHFVPAGMGELPTNCPCCGKSLPPDARILDHSLGEKGALDADGTRHAAAASMPEAAEADPDLIREVDEQDSAGMVRHPRFSLAKVLIALRTEASDRGVRGAELDREVLTAMIRIIRGLNLIHGYKDVARVFIERSRIEEVGGLKFALLPPGNTPPQVGIILNEEYDVSGSVYQTGHDLGVTRYPGRDEPDLRRLGERLPGWFVHSAGFLACWGSRKAPATTPPPEGTPQTQDELLSLLREVF